MKKALYFILAGLFLLFCGFTVFNVFIKAENGMHDSLLQEEGTPDERIIIVGMDERSLEEVGQWPWPRSYMANMIQKLHHLGAATVGIDVIYDSYSGIPENDNMLVDASAIANNIVLAELGEFTEYAEERLESVNLITPFEELGKVTGQGHINVFPDSTSGISIGANTDGVIRKAVKSFWFGEQEILSFPIAVYLKYCETMGISPMSLDTIPNDNFGRYLIDFTGKPNTYTELSFTGVLNDEYPEELFKDAIVLIGPYAVGIGNDQYATPLDLQQPMYGVEIHANTIQALLEQNFKTEAPVLVNLFVLAIWCSIGFLLFRKFNPYVSAALLAAMIATHIVLAKLVYGQLDTAINIFYPSALLFVLYITMLAYKFISEQLEKKYVTDLFGRFVAPEVVNEIINGNVSVELGGALREVTVLFVDVRGFTTFSEITPPETVVTIINKYLNLTSSAILNNKGTLDKFIGDATMAVFNAPNPMPQHALCACKTALEMQKHAAVLQQEIFETYGVDLRFGIGINTGQAIVGNIGSEFRMDYTVIGDTVNTAARLESNAKPDEIIISQAVYDCVKDKAEVTPLGELTVKGKKNTISVYRLEKIID